MVEYLNFAANVTDSFSKTLHNLQKELTETGVLAEALDEQLDFDVDVDKSELNSLQGKMAAAKGTADTLDDSLDFDVDGFDTSDLESLDEDMSELGVADTDGGVVPVSIEDEPIAVTGISTGSGGISASPTVSPDGSGATDSGGTPRNTIDPELLRLDTDYDDMFLNIDGADVGDNDDWFFSDSPTRASRDPWTIEDENSDRVRPPQFQLSEQVDMDFASGGDRSSSSILNFASDDDDGGGILNRLVNTIAAEDDDRSTLKQRLSDLAPTMSEINNLYASLIPALAVFIGALPAAITGLVALGAAALGAAAGLAGIAGLSALGAGMVGGQFQADQLREKINATIENILTTIQPLAEAMAPMFDAMLQAAEDLVQGLVERGSVLLAFKDDFKGFLGFLVDAIPPLVANLVRFGDVLSPIFAMLGQGVSSDAVFDGLANYLADILPILIDIGAAFLNTLPTILQFSKGLLFTVEVVLQLIGVLRGFFGFITQFIPFVDNFTSGLGLIVGLLAVFVSLVGLATSVSSAFGAVASALGFKSIPALISALTGLNLTLTNTLVLIGAITGGLVLLAGILGTVMGGMSKLGNVDGNVEQTVSGLRDTQFGGSLGVNGTEGYANPGTTMYETNISQTIEAPDREQGKASARDAGYAAEQVIDSQVGGS